MKFTARLRFIFGILFVIILGGALFLYLDYSMAHVNSVEAQIGSDSYSVGMEYASIVEKQFVEENAVVRVGDPLFELRSPTLADAIRGNDIAAASLLYSITPRGTVLITAAAAGKVQSVARRVGDFVPANSELAKINQKDGLYIKATYKLAAPDYARLGAGSRMRVSLPDGVKLEGRVYDVALATRDKQVYTTVKARIQTSKVKDVFAVGTPVKTTLNLNDDTWLSRLNRSVRQLFEPGGK